MGLNNDNFQGKVQPGFLHITSELVKDASLKLQVHCVQREPVALPRNGNTKKGIQPQLQSLRSSLSITLYGPITLYDEIGEFFESYEMFIQDPQNCDLTVRYCNPHRLSSASLNNCQWTSDLNAGNCSLKIKDISAGSDVVDLLDSQVELAESPQPLAIETLLKRYSIFTPAFVPHR